MKRFSFLIVVCLFITTTYAQTGHEIQLTLKPYKHVQVYLGFYYGKAKAVADSAILDENSLCTFKGKDTLAGGIYFVVSPKREILFELLVDNEQHFSMSADSADAAGSLKFAGSPGNDRFLEYSRFMAKKGGDISNLRQQLQSAKAADSTRINEKIKSLNAEVTAYREQVEQKYPTSLLATVLRALKEPVVPPIDKTPGAKNDSLFAYHYFKAHYWDGVSLTDDRLIRTPVFEPKLDKYFKDLVPPDPDSISREADHMLLFSRTNKEMFKYLMVYFVQKYINPEYMGQDAVFVNLFEKYINTGQADFFTEKNRKFINDRAYSLMANLIGQPAANMDMVDTANKPKSLFDIQAKYIVVCFWDPTCSHCKETVPKLDSIYRAKWKNEGVVIYGVMVDGGHDNWINFIREHQLNGWIHVYQTKETQEAIEKAGKPGYKQLYDVYQTPMLYLLDGEKRIVAKKLSYLQMDEILDRKIKTSAK